MNSHYYWIWWWIETAINCCMYTSQADSPILNFSFHCDNPFPNYWARRIPVEVLLERQRPCSSCQPTLVLSSDRSPSPQHFGPLIPLCYRGMEGASILWSEGHQGPDCQEQCLQLLPSDISRGMNDGYAWVNFSVFYLILWGFNSSLFFVAQPSPLW